MKIIAIDTSCDDASVAVSENDWILANVIHSQVEVHSFWGGVVPSLAKRQHQEHIDATIEVALKRAGMRVTELDVVAVTTGPGLAVALEVGVAKAKELSSNYGLRIVEVNHMAGHIWASFARNRRGRFFSNMHETTESERYPFLAVLISGGHTELVKVLGADSFVTLGRTKDDALGEAYDKVARMLNLGYPGGPIIEKLALEGDRLAYAFPISMRDGSLDFSYSGLKTAVLRKVQMLGEETLSYRDKYLKELNNVDHTKVDYALALSTKPTYLLDRTTMLNIAASFEYAATVQLVYKLRRCLESHKDLKYVVLGGGVVNNKYVRGCLRNVCRKFSKKMIYPKTTKLIMDNAGMVAVAGYVKARKGLFVEAEKLDRRPGWELGS
jgi:glycoprotease/Kae1 family metallohydrolase